MYGIFFYIFVGITRVGAKIILFLQDIFRREEARGNNKEVYTDHNGASRLVSTNKRFTATEKPNGHWVWTDDKCNIIKDLSQESIEKERKENYEFAIKNGYSTYIWLTPQMGQRTQGAGKKIYKNEYAMYFKDNMVPHVLPVLYKDIKSGEIYTVGILYSGWKGLLEELSGEKFKHDGWLNMKYFINPKTMEIIRPVDEKCRLKTEECLTWKEIQLMNKITLEKNKSFILKYEPYSIYKK